MITGGERTVSLTLQSVVSMNNEGVRLYQEGRLEQAREMFQIGLDELTDAHPGANQFSVQPLTGSREFDSHPISGWSNQSELAELSWEDDRLYMFSRAIVLGGENLVTETEDDLLFSLKMMSACILFNMALNHHVWAVDTTERGIHRSETASPISDLCYAYERSFQDLQLIGLRIQQQSNWRTQSLFFDLDLLMAALLNNMGVLYCNEMARFEHARECFQATSRLLLGCQSDLLEERLSQHEISRLCMNIWMASSVSPAA